MANSKGRGRWDENEIYEWRLAKLERRRRRQRGLQEKQRSTRSPGLRTQGEAAAAVSDPRARYAEPTREEGEDAPRPKHAHAQASSDASND